MVLTALRDRPFRERIAFACGATHLSQPLALRARDGEPYALSLLAKLIDRKQGMGAAVLYTRDEIRERYGS